MGTGLCLRKLIEHVGKLGLLRFRKQLSAGLLPEEKARGAAASARTKARRREVIGSHHEEAKGCYETRLALKANLEGRVLVNFWATTLSL